VLRTGHEAFDWRTETIDASVRDSAGLAAYGTHHPSSREADFALRRLTDVLREFGTDLSHAIRQTNTIKAQIHLAEERR
jgi:hypothetical protein